MAEAHPPATDAEGVVRLDDFLVTITLPDGTTRLLFLSPIAAS